MKKNYLKYGLIACIGIANSTYCIDQIPHSNNHRNAAPVTLTNSTSSILPTTVTNQTPVLVPFNLDLYQLCHEKRASTSWHNSTSKLTTIITCTIILSSGLLCITDPLIFQKLYTAFMVSPWYSKVYTLSYQIASIGSLIHSFLYASTTIATDFNNYKVWKNRDVIALSLKEALWNQEIYTQLGNPLIEGVKPATGTYYLVGEKKNGAGKVIIDPFDTNQVKILLGIHNTITESLQCSKITIVSSVQFNN